MEPQDIKTVMNPCNIYIK